MKTRQESDKPEQFQRHVVIVEPNDVIMLTLPKHNKHTCVYIRNINGKLEFEGGASIIESFNGERFKEGNYLP